MGRPLSLQHVCVVLVVIVGVFMLHEVSVAADEVALEGCEVPLVVFGASMLDVGQNSMAQPLSAACDFVPYGIDYFGRPAGRFSNGRLITDFLSQGLGYGLLDPYLNSVYPNFEHGVSFASSGSTARNATEIGSSTRGAGLFPLDMQVKQYQSFKSRIRHLESKHKGLKGFKLPTTTKLSMGIHIMMPAHNDYVNVLSTSSNFDALSLVVTVVAAIESALRDIHKEGARVMILFNVLPLGCAPASLAIASESPPVKFDNDSCVASYNSVVDLHNSHLKAMVEQLRRELTWEGLVLFDYNGIYLDAVRHPSKYGITKPLTACCGAGGGDYNINVLVPCGSTMLINGTTVTAERCSHPAEHLSWDGLHPIESFAKKIANAILLGDFIYPGVSIKDACKA